MSRYEWEYVQVTGSHMEVGWGVQVQVQIEELQECRWGLEITGADMWDAK
jgi:hypothetical protein